MSKTKKRIIDIVSELKVAIYIRVSTKWQVDKDSLPLQREELPKYAELVLGIKNYEVFEDAGYSAKNTDRPAYQRMMARVRSGEFSHILVWKIDRISRNLLDFASMYQELKDYGVTFVSKNEQFDTSTAIGEAMLKIILVFAELERNMTSERVTAVMLSRAEHTPEARPGMVRTTTIFWATSTETTPSLKMLRRRTSKADGSFRSDTAYRYPPELVSSFTSRRSLMSREMVAWVVEKPLARSASRSCS